MSDHGAERHRGRPQKAKKKRRASKAEVRLTPEEKAAFERQAEAVGLSVSALIRKRVLGKKVRPGVDAKMRTQLRQLGLKLGRLQEQAAREGAALEEEALMITLDELRAALRRVGADGRQTKGSKLDKE